MFRLSLLYFPLKERIALTGLCLLPFRLSFTHFSSVIYLKHPAYGIKGTKPSRPLKEDLSVFETKTASSQPIPLPGGAEKLFSVINDLHSTLRDKYLHYVPDRQDISQQHWLLVSFENQWFNIIDLKGILASLQYINPYPDLQLRWLYPQPPQRLSQSLYKSVLQDVQYDQWIKKNIPNFDHYTSSCHCQQEHRSESRSEGHLATGNIDKVIRNEILIDRIQRGPNFRETPNGDLKVAVTAAQNCFS